MKQLCSNDATIYAFDKNNTPKLSIKPGEKVKIITKDCFSNQVDEENRLADINWNQINPATGPIFIEGAEAGDILKVTIHSITLADQGVCAVGPGFGLVPLPQMTQKIIPIEEQQLHFSDEIVLPLTPMIGVIGVAPDGDPISTGTPAEHGGNMDTKLIKEGATLYLPIFVDGALFALGDLHAAMGDGEIGGSGLEIAGEVVVTLDLIKEQTLTHPVVENEGSFAFLVSRKTIDDALTEATHLGVQKLAEQLNISLEEATMLGSIACDVEISQLVDPQLTARFVIPKRLLPALF
ncbi:acetamidase/formamidase family protein [Ignatzschineria cameli]|uniref:Acetamidase n=1 Tax=Ignatzschineria cameli TaxID=2182793 RepID=A0A2U2ARN3_9GAMM|nr:acetamidase/formamidase family protein [Ignatzschineria cameli]PWD83502.1 acetamidase [Ignatzschineria cameli]PWD86827.1 acetamidase [Ignatzschineria cameli]PWD91801.1 acetamidase [Ignatzschineria cameli]PWD93613.1 acetamidase [Ignatzschineria cameli]PWD94355.1 acetamidase [Ignatzschineria cameli]